MALADGNRKTLGISYSTTWEVHVPVLILFRWKGDPDQLIAAYDKELRHPSPREQPRRISHTCAKTRDGMVVVDVWESEEDFRAMMENPAFQQNLREAGTPKPDSVEVLPVHASIP